jgi:hypothetical protein
MVVALCCQFAWMLGGLSLRFTAAPGASMSGRSFGLENPRTRMTTNSSSVSYAHLDFRIVTTA